MTNATVYQYPAIGACLQCNQLFLVTTPDTRCLLCGGTPSALLRFTPPVGAPLVEPQEPPLPAGMSPITIHAAIDCPHCGQSFVVPTTGAHIFVIPPPPAPPAEEAAPVDSTPAAAVSPAGPTEPPPAMAHDVFGNPIEGPPVGAQGPAPEDPLP